ncbi:MAG: dynamin family protein [Thermodesulfobacteriota bacterium]
MPSTINQLIDSQLAARRQELSGLLDGLQSLAARIGREDFVRNAKSLAQAAGEPFLFVAAGEVKTGKSSFINALLGAEVSDVAPDPCTDRILMITHGEEYSRREEGPLLATVRLPHPILRDVAVVDTPGVDSVIDRHQEITERFIPRSDLVLFVFSALNPYTRSAWDFLSLIAGQWRRKVVLVLNQADLATAEQLKVNRAKALELARERGLSEPPVFVVSAALEAVQPELSGIEAVRRHIREMVTGGEHTRAKLVSIAQGAGRVLESIMEANAAQRKAMEADEAEAARIAARLDAARAAALREAAALTAQVVRRYAKACEAYLGALEMEMAFTSMVRRSVLGLFKRKSAVPAMLEELGREFRQTLEAQVDALAREGAANLTQQLGFEISDMSRELRRLAGGESPGGAADAQAMSRGREEVLRDVARALEALMDGGEDPARVDPARVARLDPKAAMGGMMVLAGGLFVLSVKGVVIDITGGALAGAGVLLAGGVMAVGRPRVLRGLKKSLAEGGDRIEAELTRLLDARVDEVFSAVTDILTPLGNDIARRRAALEELEAQTQTLRAGFLNLLDTPPQSA